MVIKGRATPQPRGKFLICPLAQALRPSLERGRFNCLFIPVAVGKNQQVAVTKQPLAVFPLS